MREVKFIKNAQGLRFSLSEMAALLKLKASDHKTAEGILKITKNKINQLRASIEELSKMKKLLEVLAKKCRGKNMLANECPILDYMHPIN